MNHELLPQSWKWVTLGEVSQPIETINPSREPNKTFTYVDIASIDNLRHEIATPKVILGQNAPTRARQRIRHGDILFSTVRTYLKNIAIVPEEYDGQVCSTGFCTIRLKPSVVPKFVFYYVLTDRFVSNVTPTQTGILYPATKDSIIFRQPIPLPPLREQQLIVSKIEELLNELTSARQALLKVPALIKRFRESLLVSAFRDELTGPDSNYQSTTGNPKGEVDDGPKVLAPQDSELQTLPSSWTWTKVGDVLREPLRNGKSARPVASGIGVPVLRLSAVTFKDFGPASIKLCDLRGKDTEGLWVQNHDILIARSNTMEYVGMGSLYEGPSDAFIFPDLMIRVRVDENMILPKFLSFYLDSHFARYYFRRHAFGTAGSMPKISQGVIEKLPVPLPPIRAQEHIVARITEMFAMAKVAQMAAEQQLKRTYGLEQSILRNAFTENWYRRI